MLYRGFRVKVRRNELTGDWARIAGKVLRPGGKEFCEAFEATMSVAEKGGGLFDGWELALQCARLAKP